ncbi:MAG: NAD(P)/FAD-dependent oxidoreductase [Candidatus Altiarchaeota archaeon]
MKADVVVVGAGPVGSIASKTLAEKGVSVICVDRKQEIGPPKRCAEGLTKETLDILGIKPHPAWAVNLIEGFIVHTPKGNNIELKLPDYPGYVLERKIFEKYLAADAINAGAKYMVKTQAESVIKKDGRVAGVIVNHMGDEKKIQAKIVVAADGADSKIARTAGLNTTNKMTDYHSGFQYELAGVKCVEDRLHFFFGDSVAPKGYAWIFPKGSTLANVGLGIMGNLSKDGGRARDYLDAFIENNPEFFKNASPVEINAGGIPVSGGLTELTSDGIMVVGDAAHHVHPITGGGMTFGMLGARMAAEVAAKAIKNKDYSKSALSEFDERWNEKYGPKLDKLYKARLVFEKLSEEDLEKLAEIFSGEDILKIANGDLKSIYPLLLTKAPKMLFLVKKLLAQG